MSVIGNRHGDVGILKVSGIPKTATLLQRDKCNCGSLGVCAKHYVLAHGEVTGHTHRFDFKNDQLEIHEDKDGTIYVKNTGKRAANIYQTTGYTSVPDVDQLSKVYETEKLHSPIPNVIGAGEVVKIHFPKEYNWYTNEIERARD